MTKRMLIDASHAEETRVVVLDGSRLEDFDVETASKKQLKGNIYLAKVVRVEPSLQAAFVEYGGNRHGFLAFGEIHPDYYQIPVADRQRLLAMQEEEARREEAEEEAQAEDGEADGQPPARAAEQRSQEGRSGRHRRDGRRRGGRGGHEEARDEAASGITGSQADAGPVFPPGEMAEVPADATSDVDAPVPVVEDAGSQAPAGAHEAAAAAQEDSPPGIADSHAPVLPAGADAEPALSLAGQAGETDPLPPAHVASTAQPDAGTAPEAAIAPEMVESAPSLPAGITQQEIHGQDGLEEPPPAADEAAQSTASRPLSMASETRFGAADEGVADDAVLTGPPGLDAEPDGSEAGSHDGGPDPDEAEADEREAPEEAGGRADAGDEERRPTPRYLRNYKIQEVIRRRQIMLIQVVKEERGSKGAALTTFISLAGRFSVLMPNSPRGGGVSRKITSAADRRRLKEITAELDLPRGMGMIVRTAGAARPKAEITRDCEYLLRLWDDIRDTTMRSVAPSLIHEEASLIKRSIRDVYSRDVEEVLVDGEGGWKAARDYMRMLMPAHARKVQLWRDGGQPLFAHERVESQLDAMLSPTVQLRSGGYLVINQTEALVAIDVNSGRSTRERGIEETALRTNLEAADEVARQLRLRDLAGLIVIDFIDMEARRHNAAVEKRLKDALREDRARIQLGSISHFGLMEMSRQRLRPSLAETSFVSCPHCDGTGQVRSTESASLHVLRAVEEAGSKHRGAEIQVHLPSATALYLLNHKRSRVAEIEARYGMRVCFAADEQLLPSQTRITRLRQLAPEEVPQATGLPDRFMAASLPAEDLDAFEEPDVDGEEPADEEAAGQPEDDVRDASANAASQEEPGVVENAATGPDGEQARRKRRRRRRGGRRDDGAADGEGQDESSPDASGEDRESADQATAEPAPPTLDETEEHATPAELPAAAQDADAASEADEESGGTRRRGRRGGRRRRRDDGEAAAIVAPAYTGPTPADPFAAGLDIFDVLELAEEREAERAALASAADIHAGPAGEPQAQAHAEIEDTPRPAAIRDAHASSDEATAEPASAASPVPPESGPEAVQVPDLIEAPMSDAPAATVEPAGIEEPAAAAPETMTAATPMPGLDAAPTLPAAPLPAEEAAPGSGEPVSVPVTPPVLIGSGEAGTGTRRGWWRR